MLNSSNGGNSNHDHQNSGSPESKKRVVIKVKPQEWLESKEGGVTLKPSLKRNVNFKFGDDINHPRNSYITPINSYDEPHYIKPEHYVKIPKPTAEITTTK